MHLCITRWRVVCVCLVLIIGFPSLCRAQEHEPLSLPEAGLTPVSSFFFIERTLEQFADFFTFDAEKQMQKQWRRTDERLAELMEILHQRPLAHAAITRAVSQIQNHLQKTTELIRDAPLLASIAAEQIRHRLLLIFQTTVEAADDADETFAEQKAGLIQKFLEQKIMGKHEEAEEFLEEISALRSAKDQDIAILLSTENRLTAQIASAETFIRDFLPEDQRPIFTFHHAIHEHMSERWNDLQSHFRDLRDILRERERRAIGFIDAALRWSEGELLQRERDELLAIDGEELFLLAQKRDEWLAAKTVHADSLTMNLRERYPSFFVTMAAVSRRMLAEKREETLRLFERGHELRDLHKEHLGRQAIDIQQLCTNTPSPEEQSTCLETQMSPAQEELLDILRQEQAAIFEQEYRLAMLDEEDVFQSQAAIADHTETTAFLDIDLLSAETILRWLDIHSQEKKQRNHAREILDVRRTQEQSYFQNLQEKLQEEYLRKRDDLRLFWSTYSPENTQDTFETLEDDFSESPLPPETPPTETEFLPSSLDEGEDTNESSPLSSSAPNESIRTEQEGPLPIQSTSSSSKKQSENPVDNTAERQERLHKEIERERERKREEQKRIDQWGKPTSSP